jgi:UDP-N-acetylmuramate--alanine ligase
VLTVFQPHRFTRTLHCHDDFLKAFRDCDALFLTDIYAAGEDPIDGVNSEVLARDISVAAKSGQVVRYAGSLDSAREMLLQEIKDGDLVLCLGAGSITRLPEKLVEGLNG